VYYVNDYIPHWIYSNSRSRQLLAMAKWKVLAKVLPVASNGRSEQLFFHLFKK